jgi:polyisoprenoid-binding protein YceI
MREDSAMRLFDAKHLGASRRYLRTLAFTPLVFSLCASAQRAPIDRAQSTVTIKVYKSGLFSGFAHDHTIQAPIASGTIDSAAKSVEVAFNSSEIKVLDPGSSDSERQDIDSTMKSDKVLDVAKFPSITFSSTAVSGSPDHAQVTGTLKLHGVSRSVAVPVAAHDGKYTGSVTLKQTDFGITPVKIAGGAVRVKDEIVIDFTIVPEAAGVAH